ncbi:hypothetical protein [Methanobrevibacter arboriphilus]|uniref:hypothetical protein n=1 Tax=Methanobrevibacter arboriphilus TaxID=39441 RepID=UPI0006D1423A|nr:hypothetical protein [Methanobrevibacter arboriphilus]
MSIPNDKNDFEIKAESQVLGKKIGIDSLSIVRILTPRNQNQQLKQTLQPMHQIIQIHQLEEK